jgi:hypothetical protein
MEENKNQKEHVLLGYFRGYKKEIDNTPKKEAKAQFQSESDKKRYSSGSFVLLVTMGAVIVTSALLLWAIYSVIHVSHLSQLAGINLTEDAKKTADEMMKKNANADVPAGYEGWQTYKNDIFELRYPPEWTKEEKAGEIVIRKFNKKTYGYFDSLALSIIIKQLENPNNLEILEYLKANKLPVGEKNQVELGGKQALRTGVLKDAQGLTQRIIYWPMSGKVMQLDATFYNSTYEELFGDYEKIVQSIKFL